MYKRDLGGQLEVSGKVFDVLSVSGLKLYSSGASRNKTVVVVDPKMAYVTFIVNSHEEQW